jgi:hypothetical protein
MLNKNWFYFSFFFLFIGCKVDRNLKFNDIHDQEEKYIYHNVNGKYYLSSNFISDKKKVITFENNKPTIIADTTIITSVVPRDSILFENNIVIDKFVDNYLYLIKREYNTYDVGYKDRRFWKMKCQITKGDKKAFNNGETIEVKEVDLEEHNKAEAVLYKAEKGYDLNLTMSGLYCNPNLITANFTIKNHVFLINKKQIEEELSSSIYATILMSKDN